MRRATTDNDGPVSSRTRFKSRSNRRIIVISSEDDIPMRRATTDNDGPVSSWKV